MIYNDTWMCHRGEFVQNIQGQEHTFLGIAEE